MSINTEALALQLKSVCINVLNHGEIKADRQLLELLGSVCGLFDVVTGFYYTNPEERGRAHWREIEDLVHQIEEREHARQNAAARVGGNQEDTSEGDAR